MDRNITIALSAAAIATFGAFSLYGVEFRTPPDAGDQPLYSSASPSGWAPASSRTDEPDNSATQDDGDDEVASIDGAPLSFSESDSADESSDTGEGAQSGNGANSLWGSSYADNSRYQSSNHNLSSGVPSPIVADVHY